MCIINLLLKSQEREQQVQFFICFVLQNKKYNNICEKKKFWKAQEGSEMTIRSSSQLPPSNSTSLKYFFLFSFLLRINLKLIIVHVEINIVNKEAATKRSTLVHAQRTLRSPATIKKNKPSVDRFVRTVNNEHQRLRSTLRKCAYGSIKAKPIRI